MPLTDTELRVKAAEMMGWRLESVTDDVTGLTFDNWVDEHGRGIIEPDEWNPHASLDDAVELQKHCLFLGHFSIDEFIIAIEDATGKGPQASPGTIISWILNPRNLTLAVIQATENNDDD